MIEIVVPTPSNDITDLREIRMALLWGEPHFQPILAEVKSCLLLHSVSDAEKLLKDHYILIAQIEKSYFLYSKKPYEGLETIIPTEDDSNKIFIPVSIDRRDPSAATKLRRFAEQIIKEENLQAIPPRLELSDWKEIHDAHIGARPNPTGYKAAKAKLGGTNNRNFNTLKTKYTTYFRELELLLYPEPIIRKQLFGE